MKEADLCQRFKTMVESFEGWSVYPETSRWDMLLVGPDGVQVGVEAKLRANVDVLSQAIHGQAWPGKRSQGPDYHAVLVPKAKGEFKHIAGILHIIVFTLDEIEETEVSAWRRKVMARYFDSLSTDLDNPMLWDHRKQSWVPPIHVNVPAGVPSPESVTPWKLGAVELCLILRDRGFITTRDFRAVGVNMTQFWRLRLRNVGRTSVPNLRGKGVVYVSKYAPNGRPLPDEMWPDIRDGLVKAAA